MFSLTTPIQIEINLINDNIYTFLTDFDIYMIIGDISNMNVTTELF